jgi:hypothetical protein
MAAFTGGFHEVLSDEGHVGYVGTKKEYGKFSTCNKIQKKYYLQEDTHLMFTTAVIQSQLTTQ